MSRIYKNCKEMLSEEFRNLVELGVEVQSNTMQDKNVKDDENYKTKELIGNTFTIINTNDKEEMYEIMKNKYNIDISREWADKEFEERISNKKINPGKAWKLRKEIWQEFLHKNKFSYTYNERLINIRNKVINQLKENKNSRQALMCIFNPNIDTKNMGGKARIPCSIYYQFLVRKIGVEEKLNMIYAMRSSDLLTHFINDVYLAVKMQEYVSQKLSIEKGTFTMFISSFHAYYKDLKKYNIF